MNDDFEFEILPWMTTHFTEREIKEIEYSMLYAHKFNHGTDGHNYKLIIAGLVSMLNNVYVNTVHKNDISEIMGIGG